MIFISLSSIFPSNKISVYSILLLKVHFSTFTILYIFLRTQQIFHCLPQILWPEQKSLQRCSDRSTEFKGNYFFPFFSAILTAYWTYFNHMNHNQAKGLIHSFLQLLCKQTSVSVQSLSHVWLFATPWTAACQASLSIINSWVYSNSCPLGQRWNPTISSSVVPFSSHLQSLPASGPIQMSQFFASGGQTFGVSASASVLPINIQDWFPLGWTGCISLLSKGVSRVFSNTTVQKHQYFGAELSL